MIVKEYRVVLPCSVEEYRIGQLYTVAEASKNETGGLDGVQVLENRPSEDGKGQFTHKVYYLRNKIPRHLFRLTTDPYFIFYEKAWNNYPYCKTEVTNEVMKDFRITIETWHKPDLGNEENVHKLDEDKWKNVTVVPVDIANRGQVSDRDYKPEEDPTLFKSTKTGRGPLGPNWKEELAANPDWPRMCAYKLVTADFKWFGMRDSMEHFAQEQEMRLFTNFHRQLFCSIDKWVDLTMDDIRRIEDQTTKDLDELRKTENLRGRTAE